MSSRSMKCDDTSECVGCSPSNALRISAKSEHFPLHKPVCIVLQRSNEVSCLFYFMAFASIGAIFKANHFRFCLIQTFPHFLPEWTNGVFVFVSSWNILCTIILTWTCGSGNGNTPALDRTDFTGKTILWYAMIRFNIGPYTIFCIWFKWFVSSVHSSSQTKISRMHFPQTTNRNHCAALFDLEYCAQAIVSAQTHTQTKSASK